MSSSGVYSSFETSNTSIKLSAFEYKLQKNVIDFKDIVKEFVEQSKETADYKRELIRQKEICQSNSCSGAEALKKTIESKDRIIQLVASALTKLYETKNFNIINEALKIICGDSPNPVKRQNSLAVTRDKEINIKTEEYSPKKDLSDSIQDVSFNNESMSEIEGTPGRTSPIIQSKKLRNGLTNQSSDYRDKKKCPDNWPTPENKALKLIFTTPTKAKSKGKGKLRQSRLNVVDLKQDKFIDLTCSPELMCRDSQNDGKSLVKKESTDNNETILPSPTSGPPNIPSLLKNILITTPLKKSQLSLKSKSENFIMPYDYENLENSTNNNIDNEDSFNFLKPQRITKLQKHSPIKDLSIEYDETHCEISASLSILQQVHMMSPSKRPLAENKNIVNVPHNVDAAGDSSMSLLLPENLRNPNEENVKRKILESVEPVNKEPVYKEPVIRKKAEKRVLPGWSCDQCRLFYDELYKDNPEMLAKKMDECSKHRGRNNPARPNTPDGFWNPRWDVPDDTEEFNRRNNAI